MDKLLAFHTCDITGDTYRHFNMDVKKQAIKTEKDHQALPKKTVN